MELSQEAIRRLFGEKLYILPSSESEEKAPSVLEEARQNLFTEGSSIAWKLKPNTKIALVLQKSEFENRELTQSLKDWVVNAQLATDQIGFGIIPSQALSICLTDLPVEVAIVFGPPEAPCPPSVQLSGKDIFVLPGLKPLQENSELAVSTLQQAKFLI